MNFFSFSHKEDRKRAKVAIRMEAIGGQGANSAGRILAQAAVLGRHYSGNHVSSFGSEKRGTPVQSHVRISTLGEPVRNASGVEHPDVLILFHESLISTHSECLDGVSPRTDVIVNSARNPEDLGFPVGFRCERIATVDGTGLANKYQAGLNSVMLGASMPFLPEIPSEEVLRVLVDFFRNKSGVAGANSRAFEAGARKVRMLAYSPRQSTREETHASLPRFGWSNAPIGGVIPEPGNTVLKDNSVSRKGWFPFFNGDLCISCGFCDMVCPDFCFVWDHGGPSPVLKGIDYQFCKGCRKCVSICPVDALVPQAEVDPVNTNSQGLRLFPRNSTKPGE